VIKELFLAVGVAIVAPPACKKAAAPASDPAPAPTVSELPARWAALHLPTDGLQKIESGTDEHTCTLDYAGNDSDALWDKVTAALKAAGYVPACNSTEIHVRGFRKGDDRLAMKIDSIGGLVVSIFDAHGKEPLLHGVCFGLLKLGPPQEVSPRTLE
jgi:hypothetical protein